VSRASVSREHGKFYPVGDCWCYSDIGSTNGSWFDGNVVKKNESVIVRPGDKVQLADTFVVVAKGERNYELSPASVVVVSQGEPLGEFDLSQGGVFVFGGPHSSIKLGGEWGSPVFEVGRKDQGAYLEIVGAADAASSLMGVSLNGRAAESGRLADRDRLEISGYELLINSPPNASRSRGSTMDTSMALGVPSEQGGDMSAAKAVTAQISGRVATSIRAEQTVSLGSRPRSASPTSSFGQMIDTYEHGEEKMEALLGHRPAVGVKTAARDSLARDFSEPSLKDKFYVIIGITVSLGIILFGLIYILSLLGLIKL
jgi:pSer/pThr/pTyr-binding forkhead associated (FHA) protein